MLSRSETIMRLIKIRRLLKDKEQSLNEVPDDYHANLKQELDGLLVDIIGVPEEGRHQVHRIMDKVVKGDIKPRTAVVALHEIYRDFNEEQQENTPVAELYNAETDSDGSQKDFESEDETDPDLEELYNSGYR